MSAYRHGIAGTTGGGDIGADPLVWTPSAVGAEKNRIRVFLDAVNLDVSAGAAAQPPTITHDEWNNWSDYYQSAHKFLDDASTLWGSNVAQAREYESGAGKWRALLQTRGAKTSGPDQQKHDIGLGSAPAWLYPVIAIGGIVAVTSLVKSVKS